MGVGVSKLYSCNCGGFKFYTTYSLVYCAVCRNIQPGRMYSNYVPVYPEVIHVPKFYTKTEETAVLSETD